MELYREALAMRGRGEEASVRASPGEAAAGVAEADGPPAGRGAPLLDGAVIELSSDAVLRFVGRRLDPQGRAGELLRPDEAARCLEAAIAGDRPAVEGWAEDRGADPARLGAVTDLAVLAVLLDASRSAGSPHQDWPHGYCPTCGAWPALAEVLGLEGGRRLRCSRCGTGWRRDILHCAFCGERDHRQQLTLADEGREGREWIDACKSCRGYTKSFARLSSIAPEEVILVDLGSLALDVVALERDYRRPAAPGHPVRVRLAVRA